MYVNVHVDTTDVLNELSEDELIRELNSRAGSIPFMTPKEEIKAKLREISDWIRSKGNPAHAAWLDDFRLELDGIEPR